MGGTLWARSTSKDRMREHNASKPQKTLTVRPKQHVRVARWDPNENWGGGGTVKCRLAKIDKGWGIRKLKCSCKPLNQLDL